jgi:hypothetical protein
MVRHIPVSFAAQLGQQCLPSSSTAVSTMCVHIVYAPYPIMQSRRLLSPIYIISAITCATALLPGSYFTLSLQLYTEHHACTPHSSRSAVGVAPGGACAHLSCAYLMGITNGCMPSCIRIMCVHYAPMQPGCGRGTGRALCPPGIEQQGQCAVPPQRLPQRRQGP